MWILRLWWPRSHHCQCLQEGQSHSPVALALGQSLPVCTPAGTSRPKAALPECLSTTQTAAPLGSLTASPDPSLGTKPPSPSQGPRLRTRLTITVLCIWVVAFTQWCKPMGKCNQNLLICPECLSLRGRRNEWGWKLSTHHGEGAPGSHSPAQWFITMCLLQSLPGCVHPSSVTPERRGFLSPTLSVMMGVGWAPKYIIRSETWDPTAPCNTRYSRTITRYSLLHWYNLAEHMDFLFSMKWGVTQTLLGMQTRTTESECCVVQDSVFIKLARRFLWTFIKVWEIPQLLLLWNYSREFLFKILLGYHSRTHSVPSTIQKFRNTQKKIYNLNSVLKTVPSVETKTRNWEDVPPA